MQKIINEYIVTFLVWIKENNFYQYKDGTWYTTKEKPYVKGEQRKFYTDEQLINLFQKTKIN
jgi:hypothetical protein